MLKALVLVCSLGVTPDLAACNTENAVYVMRAPGEYASPTTCLMRGQAYLAETSLAAGLTSNERLKVVCGRHRKLTAALG